MSREIRKIIVHCTDSDDSLDIGAREIRDWHVNDNGWSDIGYHYVIRRDGRIEKGRQDWQKGAHVRGHNKHSIGIVWVGRNHISKEQEKQLLALCKQLVLQYNLTHEDVLGHFELDYNKTCPNLSMLKLRGEILFYKKEWINPDVKDITKL